MNKNLSGHHRGNSTESKLDIPSILKGLNIQSGQCILDAGCGNGYMSRLFSKLVGDSGKVFSLDIAEQAVDRLKQTNQEPNIFPVLGNITGDTPIQSNSVDLIYLSTVYHIFSKEQQTGFVNEVLRLLKPDGRLAIVEIDKKETPFGPPLERRISPEALYKRITMRPDSLIRAGDYFYMQLFVK